MLTMLLLLTAPMADDRPPATNPLVAALAACLAIRDDARRLACTDVAAAKLVAAERLHDVATVDRAEVHRARRSLFGLGAGGSDVPAARLPAAERVDRLETTLASAVAVANGRWALTLAEGGRWQTVEAWEPLAALRPGAAVTIHAGALGSYVLKLAGQRVVRVRRIG